jgi:hypothetical protein
MSKNPGRRVSVVKPRTCLRTGTFRMMDMSVRAINESESADILFGSKLIMAPCS